MAKHWYKLLDQQAIETFRLENNGVEVGHDAELDLSAEQRRAIIAAGWVEPRDDDEPDDKSKSAKGGAK